LFRDHQATFPRPTLILQVLLQSDAKFTSARKFHAYTAAVASRSECREKQAALGAKISQLSNTLQDLQVQEGRLEEDDYVKKLDLLQARAAKMSEMADMRKQAKELAQKETALASPDTRRNNMVVIEREQHRNEDAKQESLRMIASWKTKQASAANPFADPEVPPLPASAEAPRSSSERRSFWNDHPVYGQIPTAFTSFPDLEDIAFRNDSTSPLGIPIRRFTDRVKDLSSASQALSAHAQAAAQAAQAQVQQQARETTKAVAMDLKSVLEGFLSNLGGQLATFEEGFKERMEVPTHATSGASSKTATPRTPEENVQDSDILPAMPGNLPAERKFAEKEPTIKQGAKSFVFNTRVCDSCGKRPTLVDFKCTSVSVTRICFAILRLLTNLFIQCADYDLCSECLPRVQQEPDFHAQDHVFQPMFHSEVLDKVSFKGPKQNHHGGHGHGRREHGHREHGAYGPARHQGHGPQRHGRCQPEKERVVHSAFCNLCQGP
jgi:hypothetical protein